MSFQDISHFDRMNSQINYSRQLIWHLDGSLEVRVEYVRRWGFILRQALYNFRMNRLQRQERRRHTKILQRINRQRSK